MRLIWYSGSFREFSDIYVWYWLPTHTHTS